MEEPCFLLKPPPVRQAHIIENRNGNLISTARREHLGILDDILGDVQSRYTKLRDSDIAGLRQNIRDTHQYGKYYATNLKKAKEYYSKANTPAAQLALKDVNALIQKEEAEKEAKKATTYNEEKSYERSYSSSSYDDGWCFITTAACTALQEKDDCTELMLLRSFRDTNLRNSSEGSELVEEYYRVGPMIVAQLNALPNGREEYLSLWDNYIAPSCKLIREDRLEEARDLYIAMTAMLCHRFHITVNTKGFPELCKKLQEKGISIN